MEWWLLIIGLYLLWPRSSNTIIVEREREHEVTYNINIVITTSDEVRNRAGAIPDKWERGQTIDHQ